MHVLWSNLIIHRWEIYQLPTTNYQLPTTNPNMDLMDIGDDEMMEEIEIVDEQRIVAINYDICSIQAWDPISLRIEGSFLYFSFDKHNLN